MQSKIMKTMSLDLDKTYLQFDEDDALYGVERQNEQIMQSFGEASSVRVPAAYKKVDQIIFVGLGDSALSGAVIESVFGSSLKVPVIRVGAGELPKFVSSKTLVVATSHSGEGDKFIDTVKDSRKKKAKVLLIRDGGKLASLAKREKIPCYEYEAGDSAVALVF